MRFILIVLAGLTTLLLISCVRSVDNLHWPTFGRNSEHTSMSNLNMTLTDPAQRWNKDKDVKGLSTIFGNFTANIDPPIDDKRRGVHALYATDQYIFIIDAMTGQNMWVLNVENCDGTIDGDRIASAPLVGDINKDKNGLEVVFTVTNDEGEGEIYAYCPDIEFDGTNYTWKDDNEVTDYLWNYRFHLPVNSSSPVLMTLIGKDRYVVVGAGNTLFALSADTGAYEWDFKTEGEDISSASLIPGDLKRIALMSVNWTNEMAYFYLLDEIGERRFNETFRLNDYAFSGRLIPTPAVAELDGNENNGSEIVIATPFEGDDNNGVIYVYHRNGDLYWTTRTRGLDYIEGQIEATPCIGDLDGDGVNEIVVTSWDWAITDKRINIYVLDGRTGEKEWTKSFSKNEQQTVTPSLVDVDGDGLVDVIIVNQNNLTVISGNGSYLWHYQLENSIYSQVAVGDVGLDGYLDLLAGSELISHALPEIHPVDLDLSREEPEEGENVSVVISVENTGLRDAEDILVRLYADGTLVGESRRRISQGQRKDFEFRWRPLSRGEVVVKASVDPLDEIQEWDEENNNISKTISVKTVIYLNITPNYAELKAGGGASFVLNVTNAGDLNRTFNITSLLPHGWSWWLSSNAISLGPNSSALINMSLTSCGKALAGNYSINITALDASGVYVNASLNVTVLPYYRVSLSPRSMSRGMAENQTIALELRLFNDGNTYDRIILEVDGPSNWSLNLSPSSVEVAPFGEAEISVIITSPPLAQQNASFIIRATSTFDLNASAVSYLNLSILVPDFSVKYVRIFRGDGAEVGGITGKHPICGEATLFSAGVFAGGEVGGPVSVAMLVDGTEVNRTTVDVPHLETKVVNFTHVPEGYENLTFIVDPEGRFREIDEDNNTLTVAVDPLPPYTNSTYHIMGVILRPDRSRPPHPYIEIRVPRLSMHIQFQADERGEFDVNLSSWVRPLKEGERVFLYASDGVNETDQEVEIRVYSEDHNWSGEISLIWRPSYYFTVRHIGGSTAEVIPPATVRFELMITNKEDVENEISFDTIGIAKWPPPYVEYNGSAVDEITISAGEKRVITLVVQVPDTKSLEYLITLILSSNIDPDRKVTVYFGVEVVHSSSLTLLNEPPSIEYYPSNGTLLTTFFDLRNTGNGDEPLTLYLSGIRPYWGINLTIEDRHRSRTFNTSGPVKWTLFYGEEMTVTVRLTPHDADLGTYPLVLNITGLNATWTFDFSLLVLASDLKISKISTYQVLANRDNEIVCYVKNSGNYPASWVSVTLYDPDSGFMRTTTIQSLSGGEEVSVSFIWHPIDDDEGIHTFEFSVNASEEDLNPYDNIRSQEIRVVKPLPDLRVLQIYLTDEPVADSEMEVLIEVENAGFADLDTEVLIILYADGRLVDRDTLYILGVGNQKTMTFYWKPKDGGSYVLEAYIDPYNNVDELRKDNNNMTINVYVTPVYEDQETDNQFIFLVGLLVATVSLALLFGRTYFKEMLRRILSTEERDEKEEAEKEIPAVKIEADEEITGGKSRKKGDAS